MRWIVHASSEFPATHALVSYLGDPEEPHRHLWKVAIAVATDGLNEEGYAVDFHAVQGVLNDLVAPLADSDLNAHPEVGDPTPSAERLAQVVAGWVVPKVADLNASLVRVSVWEGADNRVDLEL